MKTKTAAIENPHAMIRAGIISSLILTISYLYITGLSNLPRVWTFIGLLAVCLVLMLKSVVDLLVWTFGCAARFSGRSLGRTVRLLRRVD